MQFPTQWVGGGAGVALLGIAFFILVRLVRLLNGQIERVQANEKNMQDAADDLRNRIVALEQANDRCERRVAVLTTALIRADIPIPAEREVT